MSSADYMIEQIDNALRKTAVLEKQFYDAEEILQTAKKCHETAKITFRSAKSALECNKMFVTQLNEKYVQEKVNEYFCGDEMKNDEEEKKLFEIFVTKYMPKEARDMLIAKNAMREDNQRLCVVVLTKEERLAIWDAWMLDALYKFKVITAPEKTICCLCGKEIQEFEGYDPAPLMAHISGAECCKDCIVYVNAIHRYNF